MILTVKDTFHMKAAFPGKKKKTEEKIHMNA